MHIYLFVTSHSKIYNIQKKGPPEGEPFHITFAID